MIQEFFSHSNRRLDMTVEAVGLRKVIKFLARMHVGDGFRDEDPFVRAEDRLSLAWRMASDGKGIYLGVVLADPGPDLEYEGWEPIGRGLRAKAAAKLVKRKLKRVPAPDADLGGLVKPGYRIQEPFDAWLAPDSPEDPDDDYECAIAYVTPWTCAWAQ